MSCSGMLTAERKYSAHISPTALQVSNLSIALSPSVAKGDRTRARHPASPQYDGKAQSGLRKDLRHTLHLQDELSLMCIYVEMADDDTEPLDDGP
jgi:hypothetical protein